jgi:hypothetical protein
MANPNIVNVTKIYGNSTYYAATTSPVVWSALTPATNYINKIDSIVASNVTSSAVTVTVSINTLANGTGTSYRIANQISVPPNASLVIVDKTTSIYVGEAQSIVITASAATSIELTAAYENMTDT